MDLLKSSLDSYVEHHLRSLKRKIRIGMGILVTMMVLSFILGYWVGQRGSV